MPSATHRLFNVQPEAVSIVRKGANGQVFFLRKSDGSIVAEREADAEPLIPLPRVDADDAGGQTLIAKSDWSAVYCVVAAPGVVENGGMLAPDVWDEWASEDEIRKAAHAFMENGALVNRMHEDLQPYGTVVENAVALADLDVDGATIKKGSWYIAIKPTDEGRDLIEKGEFTGVSVQGSGTRSPIEKADPKKQGTKGHDREGKGTSQVCSGCGGKVAVGAKTCQNCGKKLSGSTGTEKVNKLLAKMAQALGIDPGEYEDQDDVVKAAAVSTFSQRIAAREVEDDLPLAIDALRGAIYDAIYPYAYGYSDPPSPAEARASLDTSLAQFHEHLLGVFDRVVSSDLAKTTDELQADLATLVKNEATEGGDDPQEADEMGEPTKIEKLEQDVTDLKKSVSDLTDVLKPIAEKIAEASAPAPTVEDLAKSVTELGDQLATIAKGVERLGAGESSQAGPVSKGTPENPLAGLLD